MSDYALYGTQLRYELVAGQQAAVRAVVAADRRAGVLGRVGPARYWLKLAGWRCAWRAGIAAITARREERRTYEKPIRDATVPPLS